MPRHLQATVISSNSVKLTWTRPEKSNGMITEYQIKWKQILGAFERMRRSVLADGERSINGTPVELIEVREHFIRNLTPHSTYSFRVREKTATGWGPFTKKIQAVTNEGGRFEMRHFEFVFTTTCRKPSREFFLYREPYL